LTMKVIKKARIVAIDYDPRGFYWVTLDNGERFKLSKKALWSWGRIQHGRKNFDYLVKSGKQAELERLAAKGVEKTRKEEISASRLAALATFRAVWDMLDKRRQRRFQAIVKGDVLVSVTTWRHVLVDPQLVRRIAEKVFRDMGIEFWDKHRHMWLPNQILGTYKRVEDMKLGVNFSQGDITTHFAIFIGQWIELEVCTNPIQWLRGMLSSYIKLAGAEIGWKARILRVTKVADEKVLESRVRELIKDVKSGEKGLLGTIKASKRKLITPEMAEIMLKAFSKSYGIGEKIQTEVLEEFRESNGKSLYDLAQATSYISWSSQKFRLGAKQARARLSAIAAVMTVLKDPAKTVELCKARLAQKQA